MNVLMLVMYNGVLFIAIFWNFIYNCVYLIIAIQIARKVEGGGERGGGGGGGGGGGICLTCSRVEVLKGPPRNAGPLMSLQKEMRSYKYICSSGYCTRRLFPSLSFPLIIWEKRTQKSTTFPLHEKLW
jgi:hypothetical protein